MRRKHYYELDFVRAVCAIIVVCYHFTCACAIFELRGFKKILYTYPNGTWGEMAVSVFFMISGAVLVYNYQNEPLKLEAFYKKRWLSLFPMFYLIWGVMYFRSVVLNGGNWFWGGSPKLILLSLFGIDGYFYYLKPNYYFIGEWFLGAIIFLYLIFPLLKKMFERFRLATTAVLFCAWGMIFIVDWFKVDPFRNPITCICSFWIGMVLMEYREKWKKFWPCFAAGLYFCSMWKLPINTTLGMNLTAIAAFIVLYTLGGWVMKSLLFKKIILSISRNSYGIFLTHHVIIDNWVKTRRHEQIGLGTNLLWLVATLAVAYISAVLLRLLAEALLKVIKKLTNRLLH